MIRLTSDILSGISHSGHVKLGTSVEHLVVEDLTHSLRTVDDSHWKRTDIQSDDIRFIPPTEGQGSLVQILEVYEQHEEIAAEHRYPRRTCE